MRWSSASTSGTSRIQPGAISKLRAEADHWLPQVKGVPVVALSGLTGEGLDRLMQAIIEIHAVWNKRVPTNQLNRWLDAALAPIRRQRCRDAASSSTT